MPRPCGGCCDGNECVTDGSGDRCGCANGEDCCTMCNQLCVDMVPVVVRTRYVAPMAVTTMRDRRVLRVAPCSAALGHASAGTRWCTNGSRITRSTVAIAASPVRSTDDCLNGAASNKCRMTWRNCGTGAQCASARRAKWTVQSGCECGRAGADYCNPMRSSEQKQSAPTSA